MQAKEEIFKVMTEVLETQFDCDPAALTPDAQLFTDLDLDSIDAVDLMVILEKKTGKKIEPEQFKQVRTIQDVVDAIHNILDK